MNDIPSVPSPSSGSASSSVPTSSQPVGGDSSVVPTPFESFERIAIGHAILSVVGFLVILPIGALVARWCRTFTENWFYYHWITQVVLSIPVIVTGWALGPLAVSTQGVGHADDVHKILGLLLLPLYIIQLLLGTYVHFRKLPYPKRHPPRSFVHGIWGILTIGLAFFQARTGLTIEWTKAALRSINLNVFSNLWIAWVIFIPLTYFLGFFLLPRQLAHERKLLPPYSPRNSESGGSSRLGMRRLLGLDPVDDGTHDIFSEAASNAASSSPGQGATSTSSAATAREIEMREPGSSPEKTLHPAVSIIIVVALQLGRCLPACTLTRMSVWLPLRPSHVTPYCVRSLVSRRSLHALAPRSSCYFIERTLVPRQVVPARRWKSTNESTGSGVNEVHAAPESKSSSASVVAKDDTTKVQVSAFTRAWTKVKHEAAHYWHGTKLLVSEVRISARLQWKILHGEILTRRERRQLRRTTQDLLRLVPFSVFVVVPFMELLLPVAIKFFPNMLPSTFEDKFAAEEKQRKLLRVRLEMAKFLQETLRESGLKANAHIIGSDAFKEFFRKVRATGESPSTADVVNVAKLFDDDLTLDNLSRPQLVSMCRYMGVNAFGTDNYLRGVIRARLSQLRRDDQLIDMEGIDSLSTSELQQACQSRGIRTIGASPSRLRSELATWIKLHLHNRVSGVLLILGRAFYFDRKPGDTEENFTVKSLESVLSSLPDNLVNEAELEVDSDKASYKQKLEVLQQQEELIEDEEEQEIKEEEARRAKREAEEKVKREEETLMAESLLPETELRAAEAEEEDARMTTEQLAELAEALSVLSAKSSVLKERDELKALMEENMSADEDTPLVKRVRSMITKIDTQLSEYDAKVGNSLQMISCDPQGRISVEDLQKALAVIKHKPDEDVGHAVIKKLDADKDGFVELEHVLGLVREEGLGILIDDKAQNLIGQGRELQASKPRKEDIVQE
ncbi:hypothetical protein EW145_g6640 [Phellinidium pouzarii]|uniref:Mitochondrial proton/calcium exchanger protein n=1 Tax=Phellinidium pouzarii TaxID=167371 RepID=A0A4S4KW67_9AGAM|nr:hypothetical protein EW145_g6640 [Phellinidium pouzarii]